jgi:methylenetetrahydrofolate reductase (NADPH)
MRIGDKLKETGQFVSLEFFPPKEREKWPGFFDVVQKLRPIEPLFVSVTYGAGGTTQAYTLELVNRLKNEYCLEPMAHLTCVGASEENIHHFLTELRRNNIMNVLALRGDPPKGQETFVPDSETFQHASDLVSFIRSYYPEFSVGVAGYPEVHPEAESMEQDLKYLKLKLDEGSDFVVTQLFFDNDRYFSFVDKVRAMGIDAPIIPGVLPVLSLNVLKRIASLCGAEVPEHYLAELEEADASGGAEAVAKVGVRYAREQARDLLARGAPGVHLYTLNKAEACREIVADLDVSHGLEEC